MSDNPNDPADSWPEHWPADAVEYIESLCGELETLGAFFAAWERAESNRGCYSCSPDHDTRCQKSRGMGPCTCQRDALEKLAAIVHKLWRRDCPSRRGASGQQRQME